MSLVVSKVEFSVDFYEDRSILLHPEGEIFILGAQNGIMVTIVRKLESIARALTKAQF